VPVAATSDSYRAELFGLAYTGSFMRLPYWLVEAHRKLDAPVVAASVAPTMTLDRMTQDGIELTEYLCKHLGKRKVILVAHSFGTILGLRMIREKPDLFFAYVGTGQVADETQNYAMAYEALLKKARAAGNQQAFDELKSIGPPPYANGRGYQVQRKWSNRFEGSYRFLYGTLGLALVAPGYSVRDLNDSFDGQNLSGEHLWSQTRSETMKELGLKFAIPIFFFEGTEDFTTPTELARKYLEAIQAPEKSLCRFLEATSLCL
jgi:pimeloyl-ACP methyl ester carboxylesterase